MANRLAVNKSINSNGLTTLRFQAGLAAYEVTTSNFQVFEVKRVFAGAYTFATAFFESVEDMAGHNTPLKNLAQLVG